MHTKLDYKIRCVYYVIRYQNIQVKSFLKILMKVFLRI